MLVEQVTFENIIYTENYVLEYPMEIYNKI